MPRRVAMLPHEESSIATLGRRIRLARLRRRLSQADIARCCDVSRKTVVCLEAGNAGVSIAVVAKVLAALGYPDRLADLLASDPLGEDMEAVTGRRRAGGRADVADF